MKNHVYLLEDDESIAELIKFTLEMNGLDVTTFSTLHDFSLAIEKGVPQVVLLDIMLPDGSGLDALKRVKSLSPETFVMIISALGKEVDIVRGLNMGADDYLTKPFGILELTARVKAAFRRHEQRNILRSGELVLDQDAMTVRLAGRLLTLNNKEFQLLRHLMMHAGIVLPREEILAAVWGYETGETRTLDNHIARLRKEGIPGIETVFSIGYKFRNLDDEEKNTD